MRKVLLSILLSFSLFYASNAQTCVGSQTLTATPPPSGNGTYFSGTVVTFCFTVNDYAQSGVDWLCGAVPTFGPGWDLSTLQPVSIPASCDGTGNWGWYTSCTATASGTTYGPGFFYDTPAGNVNNVLDSIPGNNFGDNCATYSWQFCFSIAVLPCTSAPNGTDLNVEVTAYSDYDAGSWGTDACTDPPSTIEAEVFCNCTLIVPTVNVTNTTCGNTSDGEITVFPTGVAPFSFLWSNGATTATISNLPAGIYTVTVTDSTLCDKVVTIPVGGPQPILLNPVVVDNGCNPNGGSVTLNPSGGNGGFTYLWSDSTTGSSINNLLAGTYSVVVTDSLGCAETDSYTINTVIPLSLTTSSTASGCTAFDGTATVTVTGGIGPYTYNWLPSGGTNSTATNLAPGVYTVDVTDANGCTSSTQVTVQGTSSFTLSSQFVPLTCDPAGTTSATINITGGSAPFNISWNPFGGNQTTATGLTSGTYTVIVTDQNNCIDSITVIIPGVIGVTASTTSTPVQCNTSNSGSATASATGTAPFTYLWSNGDTGSTATNLSGGNYTVTVTDANGCTASSQVTVNVIPDVFVSAGSDQTTCSQQPATLTGNATGGTAPYSYSWNNGPTSSSQVVSPSVTTTYTLTVTDANNCTSTSNVTVNVNQYPVISLSPATTICYGATTSLSASGGSTYSWTPSNDLDNPNSANPVASPLTNTTYIVTVSNGQCSSVDSVLISVTPEILAAFNPDTTTGEAPLEVTFVNNSSNAVSYLWSFGDGNGSTAVSPTHTYTDQGSYVVELVATNSQGCTDTLRYSYIVVNEFAALTIPNVFTPNGDGYNDAFSFIEKGITSIYVVIFNRWGNEVYSWNKKNSGWDGKSKDGNEAPDGVYFYIIKAFGIDDNPYNYQGTVQLIRVKK